MPHNTEPEKHTLSPLWNCPECSLPQDTHAQHTGTFNMFYVSFSLGAGVKPWPEVQKKPTNPNNNKTPTIHKTKTNKTKPHKQNKTRQTPPPPNQTTTNKKNPQKNKHNKPKKTQREKNTQIKTNPPHKANAHSQSTAVCLS